jgi:hypothetical protein
MKQIFVLLMCCVSSLSMAQIQISQAHMPSLGDTIRYTNASAGSFDFKATGANYNWDFTGLGYINQDIYSFKSLLSAYPTLILNGMPIGAFGYKITDSVVMGPIELRNIYNFYEKKTSGWLGVGTAFTMPLMGNPVPTGGVYSDKDEIFTFPLKYNDKDSTTFKVVTPLGISQSVSFGSFTQKGYRINKVEGWGKISTPYANAVSCIMVTSRIVEHDSIALAIPLQTPINFAFPAVRIEIKWLSTTEKIPLLEVSGTEIAGVFTPTFIRYRDKYRVSGSNPLLPKVKFTVDKNNGEIVIDTFSFTNNTTPVTGTTYLWTVTPSLGVRYVKSTSATSLNPVIVFDSSRIYSVNLKATNAFGSKDSTAPGMITITKDGQIGLQDLTTGNYLFYPNPVNNTLHLYDGSLEGKPCRIFDAAGKMVHESIITTQQIDCSGLEKGIYTILISDQNTLIYKQFIKD